MIEKTQVKIYILIATSKKRTNLLINRSLKSVYSQTKIIPENIEVVIVDDNIRTFENKISIEYDKIINLVTELRDRLKLTKNQFKTRILTNIKTQFKSGTGAWNTGIEFINKQNKNKKSFTAILDDDDEYKDDFLQKCITKINNYTLAVFAPIIWKGTDFEQINYIKKEELTAKHFFIGNPGVQGSNMFFMSDVLYEIGGFDENMPSTTDRDLMIRFFDLLDKFQNLENRIIVLNEPLIIHYANGNDRVTDNKILKKEGLDIFYNKYKSRFSETDFQKSLNRAKKFFEYKYEKQ